MLTAPVSVKRLDPRAKLPAYGSAAAAGAVLQGSEGLICNEAPDEDALASCRALGRALAG